MLPGTSLAENWESMVSTASLCICQSGLSPSELHMFVEGIHRPGTTCPSCAVRQLHSSSLPPQTRVRLGTASVPFFRNCSTLLLLIGGVPRHSLIQQVEMRAVTVQLRNPQHVSTHALHMHPSQQSLRQRQCALSFCIIVLCRCI